VRVIELRRRELRLLEPEALPDGLEPSFDLDLPLLAGLVIAVVLY